MSLVINLHSYVGASNSRLLVMVDLQERNFDALNHGDPLRLTRSLDNCLAAIRHARAVGLPIAFTRRADPDGAAPSAWIKGLEPKRADMVFEREAPSCYSNQLFDDVVSPVGSYALAGLFAEETCLATAIDASHRGHRVTYLGDASVCRGRRDADGAAVHLVAAKAIELFADVATTAHWLVATSQRPLKGHRYG